ncbi:alpha/beta hydrolase [Streptomyces sp. G45]|uniref:alpha/beta hydrolase n=1 Tax=Streptomyces sp. G45 TaxID=3406627 RepID=UPI003C236067
MNTSTPRVNPDTTGTRRRARSALPALAALAALSTVAAPAAVAAERPSATTSAYVPAPIRWGACEAIPPLPEPSPRAQCGTVEVPVDWSEPEGPKTVVHVARHRATDPARRIGVLMANPGGPGDSGVDDVLYADDPVSGYEPDLLQRFDMVGFDPRGVARSRGAECDESLLDAIPDRPRDAAEFRRLRTRNAKLARSCLERSGPLAAHMDGESVARDMDAIRAAVGERRISFLGHSYGTFLGERYARLFPERLRALALDSAMDPDRPGAERYLKDGSVTLDNTLKKLARWCARTTSCALNGKDLTAVTDELFARADAGTLREPGPQGPTRRKVDADRLSGFLTGHLSGWTPKDTARQLKALHTGRGEVRWLEGAADPVARLVLCRDFDLRIKDHAEYRAIRERVAKAAPHVRYNAQALDTVLGCQGWTVPPKPRPARAEGELPPVLVVNARYDVATPLPGARRMARSFPEASLHTEDTVGHWLYMRGGSNVPRQLIDTYLKGRTD